MAIFYKEDLDKAHAGAQSLDWEEALVIRSKCHPAEPIWAAYRDGGLTLNCSKCGREIIRIAIASQED